jgi:hypothetical protein
MTLCERVRMPSFAGATEWLNSEPLGPAELRGHVVLVNEPYGPDIAPAHTMPPAPPGR